MRRNLHWSLVPASKDFRPVSDSKKRLWPGLRSFQRRRSPRLSVLGGSLSGGSRARIVRNYKHPLDAFERVDREWERAVRDLHHTGWRQ